MLNIIQDDITDTDTDPSECSALATCLEYGHGKFDITDAMRREALRIRSTGRVSAVSINGLILPSEEDCLSGKEMSLEDVSSEGLRQWNMDMDVEYQYETFNGLPVYYGGDMYDSEDSEDDPLERARAVYVEDYNFDVPEGMELMAYNQRRPDGGEARSVDTVDMVPMCTTVSCVTRIARDESSDTSGTDTAVIKGSDIEDFCQGPELSDEEDSDVGSSADSNLCISEQDDLSYADIASVVDLDSEDSDVDFCFNSDEGSVAELEWNTWDEACALDFQNASGIFPPDSAVIRQAVNIKDNIYNMEDSGHPAWDVCCTGLVIDMHGYVDRDVYIDRLCLLGQYDVNNIMHRNEEYADVRGWSHRHTVSWDPGVAESRPLAVCYDYLCLISLFRTVMSLSYDWDEVFGWIGHDGGYDCSPAGAIEYLPRCLYSPLVMNRMTQYLTQIKVLGWSLVHRETMYTNARRCVCTRGTLPGVFSAGRISLTLIGRLASGAVR